MAKYICRNCGNIQYQQGQNGGCAYTFWFLLLIFTIFIGLFAPIAFVVVAFEVLFLILTIRNPDSNYCFQCKARGCIVPMDTPAGEQLYKSFYPQEYEEEQEEEKKRLEEEAKETEIEDFRENPNKDWLWIVIPTVITFLIIVLLNGLVQPSNKEPQITPQVQQKTEPVTKPQPKPAPLTFENSPALQAKYRAEIEKTINTETAKAKKEINRIYNEADIAYTEILNQQIYTLESFDKMEMYHHSFETPMFNCYIKLIDVTEKYTQKHKELATGWYGTLADYIIPIMKSYNVSNLNKLTELESYMLMKADEVGERTEGIRKIVYGK